MLEYPVSNIPVSALSSMDSALFTVFSPFDQSVIPGFAIAINPEKVMKARANRPVMDTLLAATVRFADGIGVVWAMRLKGARNLARIPGCELWEAILAKAGEYKHPVFLVGARHEVLYSVRDKLSDKYGVNVVGLQDGYFTEEQQDGVIRHIYESGAKIVTVAMGSPKQEVFIQKCRLQNPDVFYMGVGGTYDVFVGKVKRAPAWACNSNTEWLYRLVSQPSRFGRQLVLIKYFLLILTRKI